MQASRLENLTGSCARLALFSALLLNLAVLSQAQTAAPPPPHSAVAASTKPAAQPRGQHEGIKIHGHWTIEVRNPNGKVVTHREFENSLASGSPNGGAGLLAGLLSRAVTAGSWEIALTDTFFPSNVLEISEANSFASANCASLLTGLQQGEGSLTSLSCSTNLTVAGPQLGPGGISSGALNGSTVTFQGSGVVPANFAAASLGFVGTYNYVCAPSNSPPTCVTVTANADNSFTARNLDGLNGDPAPVAVAPGQTVDVTVSISFQ